MVLYRHISNVPVHVQSSKPELPHRSLRLHLVSFHLSGQLLKRQEDTEALNGCLRQSVVPQQ